MLRATTPCTFSTSQLPKVVRSWGALYLFTSKSASRHNGVQLFISYLPRCLRTCRFSEPTFQPSGATKPRKKHSVSRLSYLFARLHLLSSDLFSSDSSPCWLLFHLSILSEVWLLNFLRLNVDIVWIDPSKAIYSWSIARICCSFSWKPRPRQMACNETWFRQGMAQVWQFWVFVFGGFVWFKVLMDLFWWIFHGFVWWMFGPFGGVLDFGCSLGFFNGLLVALWFILVDSGRGSPTLWDMVVGQNVIGYMKIGCPKWLFNAWGFSCGEWRCMVGGAKWI